MYFQTYTTNIYSWFYSVVSYLLERREKVSKKCTSDNSIETSEKRSWFIFKHGKSFIEIELVYLLY